MNDKYEAAHFDTVTINEIELTERDLHCLARKAQGYARITNFGESVEESSFSGCYACPYRFTKCFPNDAAMKVAQLTGVHFSGRKDKDGRMEGLPKEYKIPKD